MQIQVNTTKKVADNIVLAHTNMLKLYRNTLENAVNATDYYFNESSLKAPFDKKQINEIKEYGNKLNKHTKIVLLVGIGGSDMGTRAVYDAIRKTQKYGNFSNDTNPKLIGFSSIDNEMLEGAKNIFNKAKKPEEILMVVISKSGSTTETILNANILFKEFSKKFNEKDARKQTVIITNEDSPLADNARKLDIKLFSIPKDVGGRYSVFTAVGLLPLSVLAIDIEMFTKGARDAIKASIKKDVASPSSTLAALLFESYINDIRIHEFFAWDQSLISLGKWYRQLLAESIGKEKEDGTKIGISPTIAIGSTDLHSVGQLIFGGETRRFTTFVSAPSKWMEYNKNYSEDSPFTLQMLEGKGTKDAMRAIYNGVKNTYRDYDMPFMSIELEDINERELGAFMGMHMSAIMYLAHLFNLNAFDQPAVESYKNEVRRLLKDNS